MRAVRIVLLVVMVVLFMVTMWASTSLAGSGFTLIPTRTQRPFEPTYTPFACDPGYDTHSWVLISWVPEGNDGGSGDDWLAVVARRTNGSLLTIGYVSPPTGVIPITSLITVSLGTPFTGVAQVEIYDITYKPVLTWPIPLSDFNRIHANAPVPVIRSTLNVAASLEPGCIPDIDTAGQSPDGVSAPLPPDDRLNWEQGDLMAVVYPGTDSSGAPAMHVYTVTDDSQGVFLFSVTQADLAPYQDAPPPAENTIIKTIGEVNLYRLVSGEFALVIGPDKEGKNWQIIFDGIPWTYLKREQFDPATAFSN